MAGRVDRERDLVLYTDEALADPLTAKTAHGVLRFRSHRVAAIVDRRHAGRPLRDVCPWVDAPDVPIFSSFDDVVAADATIVVGLSPSGGRMSDVQRTAILGAIDRGFSVVNGLHDLLPDGPRVRNLRAPDPADTVLGTGRAGSAHRVLTVGSSGGVGKMTTTILAVDALVERGVDADWIATGQTGCIVRGSGSVIDSIVIDFVPGTIERLLGETSAAVVVVEGQGSILHPAFSPSTVALMHAAQPQHHILCYRFGERVHSGTDVEIPDVATVARAYSTTFEALGVDSRLLAVAMDSGFVGELAYERERDAISERLGVPCCDPVREAVATLVEPLVARFASS